MWDPLTLRMKSVSRSALLYFTALNQAARGVGCRDHGEAERESPPPRLIRGGVVYAAGGKHSDS